MKEPTRPALRYLGGKWKLAPRIIEQFPPHRLYVEPFGGAASVLVRKPRARAEVYNDLDGEVVNLFRVLRDQASAAELCRLIELTPFAREEFELAYEPTEDPVERARRLVTRSYMGHGSSALARDRKTGFRLKLHKTEGTTAATDWDSLPDGLRQVADRFRRVVVENRPAVEVIKKLDYRSTLFYVDPPYVQSTRSGKVLQGSPYHTYNHELTDSDHCKLLECLVQCRAMVMVSGYANALYDDKLAQWRRVEMVAHADGALARTEVLWISPAADAAHGLFAA